MLHYEGSWERIDSWLSLQFPYSRSFFQHIFSRWGIKVNEKVVKKSYTLKKDDQIEIDDLQRFLSAEILDETPDVDIPIVLEKEDYLVINKPKWVLSHPKNIRDLKDPSVTGFLHHRYKDLPTIWNFIRAWLLHRLDKNTDGLMIIAKTEKWLEHFKKLFQEKSESESIAGKESAALKKFYRATCYLSDEGEKFLADIEELPYYIQEMVIPKIPYPMPKMGITKILNVKKNTDDTVTLELEILTWRTHQIRYHLSHHGLIIVGDYLYGMDEKNPMQLTAYRLEFTDPDWEKVVVEL